MQYQESNTPKNLSFTVNGVTFEMVYVEGGTFTMGATAEQKNDVFDSESQSHPVGTKKPNELGVHDMSGNVLEWCDDWYGDYTSTSVNNPTGPSSGSDRVVRGGSWDYVVRDCRVSDRYGGYPGGRFNDVGFRLVLYLDYIAHND